MSEELLQRNLLKNPPKIGKWDFYNIGATTIKALKDKNIIRNVDYGSESKKKVDGLIVNKKSVIAVIENKIPAKFKTDNQKQSAIQQSITVAKKLKAPLVIATDTIETLWVNTLTGNLVLDESGNVLKAKFDPALSDTALIIDKILSSISSDNDMLRQKEIIDPTDLAKQIWQDVWSVSGATPENCLYTFVELFIFKYLSDLGVLTGIHSFYSLYDCFENNSADDVLETYATSIRPKIKKLFPPSVDDKTTIINGTIFVSKDQRAVKGYSAVFEKVLRKFKDYGKLENIDHDFKSKLFESFLKESISKKNWGQFFTPLKVVRAVADMAKDEIKVGAKICDPACGVGKFLLEPILPQLSNFFHVKDGKLISKIHLMGFDKGFDKDEQKTIILAKANMLIYFSDILKDNPSISDQLSALFNASFNLKTNSILGTLSEPVEDEYDLILTNPPYVTSGTSNLKDEIKKSELEYFYTQNAIGIEGLFVEWIVKALKPGGKAFIVIPDGVLRRRADKSLRNFICDTCEIDALISLPEKTFFTTLKKTYIIAITKKFDSSKTQTTPVFCHLVSDIGESLDVDRIEIDKNDLNDAVSLYCQFKGAKNHFKPSSKRAKIVPAQWFISNANDSWILENLWSDNDLIDLGIKKSTSIIKVEDFSSHLDSLSLVLSEYQNQIGSYQSADMELAGVKLTDRRYFELITGKLGMTKKQYSVLDTKSEYDIPVYTATLKPVAYFKGDEYSVKPHFASDEDACISFASDGDGTAGTNIILHTSPFYLNTSRTAFRVSDSNIDPEYIYFAIQNIKEKYGFNYKNKPTNENLNKIEVLVPVRHDGSFDLESQKAIAEKKKVIADIKSNLLEHLGSIAGVNIDL